VHVISDFSSALKGTSMQVLKWGDSLAVRLPAAVVEALGLKEGDDIEIDVAGARTLGVCRVAAGRLTIGKPFV
jgi:antitoxin component of MazEF toxin-antitoxin module